MHFGAVLCILVHSLAGVIVKSAIIDILTIPCRCPSDTTEKAAQWSVWKYRYGLMGDGIMGTFYMVGIMGSGKMGGGTIGITPILVGLL